VWTQLRDDGEEAIAAAVAELVRDGTNVSVFECVSQAEVELVAVALSVGRVNRQPFHYIEIGELDLQGIAVTRSQGTTQLPDASRLHRNLDLGADRARLLVSRLIARRVEVGIVPRERLQALAQQLRGEQPIPPESWLLG
jgi:hypothetical protein